MSKASHAVDARFDLIEAADPLSDCVYGFLAENSTHSDDSSCQDKNLLVEVFDLAVFLLVSFLAISQVRSKLLNLILLANMAWFLSYLIMLLHVPGQPGLEISKASHRAYASNVCPILQNPSF